MSIFFFLLVLLATATETAKNPSPPHPHHPHHHHHPPSPPPPPSTDLPQLTDLISALTSTSEFQTWASLLLSSTLMPNVTATLFVPSDIALSHLPTSFDPLLIPYHIVPNTLLDFLTLRNLSRLTHLPTLLPDHYILITNTSVSNFTVDESLITQPDLFLSPNFAVHGIRKVLEYSHYYEARNQTVGSGLVSPPRPHPPPFRQVAVGMGSDSAAVIDEIPRSLFLFLFFSGLIISQYID